LPEFFGVEHGIGGDIECAADIGEQSEPVGLGDVVGVHGLENEAGMAGHARQSFDERDAIEKHPIG